MDYTDNVILRFFQNFQGSYFRKGITSICVIIIYWLLILWLFVWFNLQLSLLKISISAKSKTIFHFCIPWIGRVQQLMYVAYIRMPTFIAICMILDMHTLTRTLIFKVFKIFLFLLFWFWFFKNLMLYTWPLIYLFLLGRDIFFTALYCLHLF